MHVVMTPNKSLERATGASCLQLISQNEEEEKMLFHLAMALLSNNIVFHRGKVEVGGEHFRPMASKVCPKCGEQIQVVDTIPGENG